MIPDVIGLPLDEARTRLAAAGVTVGEVVDTRPAALAASGSETRKRGGLHVAELAGDLRVVRVRGDGPADLVVTRERYVPSVP